MTNLIKSTVMVTALIGFTGCTSTSDIKVNTHKSEKVDFAGYKTYDLLQGSKVANKSQSIKISNDKNINLEIEKILNSELKKKGKTFTEQNPDLHIAYMAAEDINTVEKMLDQKDQNTIQNVKLGSMVLVAIDAQTNKILAISTAEGQIKNLSYDEKKKRITYAIKKMLEIK